MNAKQLITTVNNKIMPFVNQSAAESNYVYSPLSVSIILAMAAYSTENETREEILRFLNEGSDEKITLEDLFKQVEEVKKIILQEKPVSSASAVLVTQELVSIIDDG